ncbi:MAG TPA: hypothetical protein VES58_04515 [Syntrophobacteria bacterium]|nr:hypothetical protein [Syntrophobacteria bacterium]
MGTAHQTEEIFHIIKQINEEQKTTILLVEQDARLALTIANRGYIMEHGRIVLDDTVDRLRENEDVKRFYLGVNAEGTRRSYRDAATASGTAGASALALRGKARSTF